MVEIGLCALQKAVSKVPCGCPLRCSHFHEMVFIAAHVFSMVSQRKPRQQAIGCNVIHRSRLTVTIRTNQSKTNHRGYAKELGPEKGRKTGHEEKMQPRFVKGNFDLSTGSGFHLISKQN